MPLKLPKPF